MNILDVIKDCILNPCFVKDYDLEEFTLANYSCADTKSITKESSFTGYGGKQGSMLGMTKNGENGAASIDQRLLRMYMRVWTGLAKILVREVSQGNCVVSLDLGYFFPSKSSSGNLLRVCYSPTLELIEKYKYTLYEDEYNYESSKKNVMLCCSFDRSIVPRST